MIMVPWGLTLMHKSCSCTIVNIVNCVNNLNATKEKYKETLIKDDVIIQVALQPALKFSVGGPVTLPILGTNFSPNDAGEPKGERMEASKCYFISFDWLKEKLTAVSLGIQGSDWGWPGFIKLQGHLQIAACSNQDPLQGRTGLFHFGGLVW